MAQQRQGDRQQVAAVRHFNRFYTQHLGVLQHGWLGSAFTLSEARVLFEIRQRTPATASAIGRDLDIDAGYLSRMLRRFQKQGLIRKTTSPADARQSILSMTAQGRKALAPLEARTNRHVGALLSRLPPSQRTHLVAAMQTIEALVRDDQPGHGNDVTVRAHRIGDLGWVVSRHAELYAEEFGWSGDFEALVAQIVADFATRFDPLREHCWIAEMAGHRVGSAFLVKETDTVARLRLLLVDPAARGRGLGKRLTDDCIAFARSCGYRRITLWTHQHLIAARRIYAQAGFTLTSSEARHSFGHDVVSEHWDLALSSHIEPTS